MRSAREWVRRAPWRRQAYRAPPSTPSTPCCPPSQFLFQYKDAYKTQKFDDAVLLARWAQHDDYKFHDKLTPKSYEERDFPEARERLKGRSW